MDKTIIYRPFKSHTYFLPFTICVGVLAFVTTGYCLPFWSIGVLIPTALGVISTWLTKVLYDSANIAIFFEKEGLRVVGRRYNEYRYILWEELLYAYYVRNLKAHLFLVLSPKPLSSIEAKDFANQGANLLKVCIDDVVVIHIDAIQNVSPLKELIADHVSHVDSF